MEGNKTIGGRLKDIWNRLHNLEGDKVILIIVLLLILISFLAIFSSTPLLPAQESRLATMKEHGRVAIFGIIIMGVLYRFKINWIKYISQIGFIASFAVLLLLLTKTDIGFIQVETRNSATRNFVLFGKQIHVFEIVKVAMVMYIAWAMNAVKEDKEARKLKRKPTTLRMANSIATRYPKLKFLKKTFWKRMIYVYIPALTIIAMLFFGSGSSSILMGLALIALMIIGGMPLKELLIAGAAGVAALGIMLGINIASDGKLIKRASTFIGRITTDYDMNDLEGLSGDAYYELLDDIRQPESAKVAVHEGKILGKGIGNSTQKYKVDNIYGDYMYSFIIEEYGLMGGILILILYISLLARSSIIARMCENEFEKYAIGGLAVLITGQAFMHILVNVDIGPMTGQTLPLISHGSSAFLVFCVAFGIILSISRLAKKKIENVEILTEQSRNDIEANIEAAEKSE
jgi:cell division protein FtsW